MLTLAVKKRGTEESAAHVRTRGFVPAVFYGNKEAATPIEFEKRAFDKLWREAGETTIVTLNGLEEPKEVLIKEVMQHPVTGTVEHVDFYVLEKGKKIEIAIPIEFVGEAPIEKDGGVIVKSLHEIEIEVDPRNMPQHFVVDLSVLVTMDSAVHAKDIALPSGALLMIDPEATVVSVTEKEAEPTPEEAAQGPDLTAPVPEGEVAPQEEAKE